MARESKACALALVPPSRIPKSLLGILDSLSEGNFSLCPTFEKKSANKIQAAAAAATSAATGLAMPAEPQADVKVAIATVPVLAAASHVAPAELDLDDTVEF